MKGRIAIVLLLLGACGTSGPVVLTPPGPAGPFLGSSDFEGDWIAPPGPVLVGGQATFNGVVTVTNVDRNAVLTLLLPGYELADRITSGSTGVHPVLLVFGDQTDGASVSGGLTVPNGLHYSEMILAVPFVQRMGQAGWHTMIVRMYLDNDAMVTAGLLYGYQKQKAWLEWTGDAARIVTPTFAALLLGAFAWGTTWHDGPAALASIPNFDDLRDMMTTRLLGRNGTTPICSHFEWDLASAQVTTASTTYDMASAFTPAMTAWPAMSPFVNATDGAVVVRGVRWRLSSFPVPC